jgi:prephenate dehydrogenase
MKVKIGIIGYGRIGRLLAHHLRTKAQVIVADRSIPKRVEKGIRVVPLSEAAGADIVILAVHVRHLKPLLKRIAPCIRPDALVCDVSSVKQVTARWMEHVLPRNISLLGVHPLFGPSTAAQSVRGRSVILSPVRISEHRLRSVIRALVRGGLKITLLTPDEHDKLIARTLYLTQIIGNILPSGMEKHGASATEHFASLARIANIASGESTLLIEDLFRYNPHTRQTLKDLGSAIRRLNRRLRSGPAISR